MTLSEVILILEDVELIDFYGQNDVKFKILQKAFSDLTITSRGSKIKIVGDKKRVQACKAKVETMVRMLKQYGELTEQSIKDMLNGNNPFETKLQKNSQNVIVYGRGGKPIASKTKNQKRLVDLSNDNDIVFAIGPAGTGKTYTAVALAVRALKLGVVRRIILTRPAVEAGESLGFLPGDLGEKIDPYLRPLYDALDDMIHPEKLNSYKQSRVIEIAPLAFMRGRTLDHSFIILDEAQNCTETQLKMFLTRLGPSAKCIITGDLSQIDLPRNQRSGLMGALRILENIDGIGVLRLESADVVRHRLVKEIINAFDKDAEERREYKERRKREEQEQREQKGKEKE